MSRTYELNMYKVWDGTIVHMFILTFVQTLGGYPNKQANQQTNKPIHPPTQLTKEAFLE